MMAFMNVRGTRDFLPEEEIARRRMIDIIRETYEEFGFSPLDTPALETAEVLLAKSQSIRDEIYIFKDKGGREIGLRFDLTVPLARVMAQNPQLPLPFRRYALGKVWRYDRPQSGRYREFLQADVDIVGSPEILADAETVWAGTTALKRVGTPPFKVYINNRKLVEGWALKVHLKGDDLIEFLRTIDKWFKIGEDGVREELERKNLEGFLELYADLLVEEPSDLPTENSLMSEAQDELIQLSNYLQDFGVPFVFDARIVRGLDYYTGNVFETYVNNIDWGSIGSGGRYDELISLLSGRDIPAVGYSIGVDRLFSLLLQGGYLRKERTVTKVFVAPVKREVLPYALKVLKVLRENNIPSEIDVMGRKLRKQLEYASSLDIPYVLIVGEEEERTNTVKLKNMEDRSEESVPLEELPQHLP